MLRESVQRLRSTRSTDPFMGMQLGAVKLPPSFSFSGSTRPYFRGKRAESKHPRFREFN